MTPIEYAVAENDTEILGMLLGAVPRSKSNNFELYKDALADAIEAIPDFSMEMCFNCDSSFIPFVKAFAPSDVYKIFKRGDRMRVDMTLLGWTGTKGIRGNLSILFKGRNGGLLLVNHATKTVENVFSDLSEHQIEEAIDDLIKEYKHNQNYAQSHEISLLPVISKGKPSTQIIENCLCTKYEAKYTLHYEKNPEIKPSDQIQIKKFKSFSDYFDNSFMTFNFDRKPLISSKDFIENQRKLQNEIIETASDKKFEATVWLCHNYPLKYSQFAPLINVLSYTSEHISKFAEFFSNHKLEGDGFPIKVRVPLFYTVNANITLKNLKFESVDHDFINIDSKYTGHKSCLRIISSPEVKLYSPISKNTGKNIQSFAQAAESEKEKSCAPAPTVGEDNDKIRWTSYESDENDESILRAKQRFECLMNEEDVQQDFLQFHDKEEDVKVEIVESKDINIDILDKSPKKKEASVVVKSNIMGNNKEDVQISDTEDEISTSKSAIDNIKSHSIMGIRTLKDVVVTLETEYPPMRRFKEFDRKSPEEKKKLKNEENLKRMQNANRKSRVKITHPQQQNQWDNTKTLKKPFGGVVFKAGRKPQPEAKKDQFDTAKIILETTAGIKGIGRNTISGTRNVTFNNFGKTQEIFKKTVDVDIILMKSKKI